MKTTVNFDHTIPTKDMTYTCLVHYFTAPAGKGKGVINIDGSNLPLTPFISPRTSSALTKHGKTTVTVEQEAQLEQAIWEINSFFFYDIITKYIGTFYGMSSSLVS